MPSPAEKPSAIPAAEVCVSALSGIPLVQPGDNIADLGGTHVDVSSGDTGGTGDSTIDLGHVLV